MWLSFTTPSERLVHGISRRLIPDVGDVYFRLYEGATISYAGQATTSYNFNRNSAKTPSAFFKKNVLASGGAKIEQLFMPGQATSSPATYYPVFEETEREYKKDTTYAIQLLNSASSSVTIQYQFVWYESGN